ncbi:unnamed protein product [Allacma fusca]|uniref:Uncharacterized protein n=1 Tax=Allacma fusca TaxID=39272 RepID=A0A8J2PFN6_9HEXA|nr:unnamed protein product [Allacma fusca]
MEILVDPGQLIPTRPVTPLGSFIGPVPTRHKNWRSRSGFEEKELRQASWLLKSCTYFSIDLWRNRSKSINPSLLCGSPTPAASSALMHNLSHNLILLPANSTRVPTIPTRIVTH